MPKVIASPRGSLLPVTGSQVSGPQFRPLCRASQLRGSRVGRGLHCGSGSGQPLPPPGPASLSPAGA